MMPRHTHSCNFLSGMFGVQVFEWLVGCIDAKLSYASTSACTCLDSPSVATRLPVDRSNSKRHDAGGKEVECNQQRVSGSVEQQPLAQCLELLGKRGFVLLEMRQCLSG